MGFSATQQWSHQKQVQFINTLMLIFVACFELTRAADVPFKYFAGKLDYSSKDGPEGDVCKALCPEGQLAKIGGGTLLSINFINCYCHAAPTAAAAAANSCPAPTEIPPGTPTSATVETPEGACKSSITQTTYRSRIELSTCTNSDTTATSTVCFFQDFPDEIPTQFTYLGKDILYSVGKYSDDRCKKLCPTQFEGASDQVTGFEGPIACYCHEVPVTSEISGASCTLTGTVTPSDQTASDQCSKGAKGFNADIDVYTCSAGGRFCVYNDNMGAMTTTTTGASITNLQGVSVGCDLCQGDDLLSSLVCPVVCIIAVVVKVVKGLLVTIITTINAVFVSVASVLDDVVGAIGSL